MNSSRSYLVNALIDWIIDNGCTPHIVLDTTCEGVIAPSEFAQENRLVVNVSGTAVRNFKLDPDGLEFDARFHGESHHVSCPTGAIIGIFARENGEGMGFAAQKAQESTSNAEPAAHDETPNLPPHLRLVKD
ncbi:MAG: ClpXP protease specificity-enhancing factor SspB [Gammaproteobacteria bacterium]|nr:ClpXP protease specificity-enhancing factor SspB [Gammaproteobacteria bacterium]